MIESNRYKQALEQAQSRRQEIELQIRQKQIERKELEQALLMLVEEERNIRKQSIDDWGSQEDYLRVQDKGLILRLKLKDVQVSEQIQIQELQRTETLILKRKQVLEGILPSDTWLSHIFPEECVAELAALHKRLINKKHSIWIIRLRMTQEIVELLWAFYVQIKIDNLLLSKKSNISKD